MSTECKSKQETGNFSECNCNNLPLCKYLLMFEMFGDREIMAGFDFIEGNKLINAEFKELERIIEKCWGMETRN